jgi:hypothetical protein
MLVGLDEYEQAAEAIGVGPDPGPPLARLRRYLAGSVRRLQWAARLLEKLRGGQILELDAIVAESTEYAREPRLSDRIHSLIAGRIAHRIASGDEPIAISAGKAELDERDLVPDPSAEAVAAVAGAEATACDLLEEPGDSLADWVRGQRPRHEGRRRPDLKKPSRRPDG